MEKSVYGNYHGLDGYIRYITDEAKKYFDLGVLTHIKIEPMYDNNVVAISVEPYEFKIVSVDDVAYIRLNNESLVLNETAKRQIMNRRIFSNREKAANVSVIMEAIRDKRKVVFHNYQSSHSGESHDRNMEPFAFTTGYTHVWCYDLDKERNAVFGTERICNVEILNEHWENEIRHKQAKMDIFHMTGDKTIHVVLQLNIMAKNLLCEEYPDAKSSLVSNGEDKWILDTDVYQISDRGRGAILYRTSRTDRDSGCSGIEGIRKRICRRISAMRYIIIFARQCKFKTVLVFLCASYLFHYLFNLFILGLQYYY